jgi:predicted O-methyltransferase YrrM
MIVFATPDVEPIATVTVPEAPPFLTQVGKRRAILYLRRARKGGEQPQSTGEDRLPVRATPLQPPLLEEMLATGTAPTGQRLHSNINEAYAAALQGCVRELEPRDAIEIGMAFGTSALAILGGCNAHLTSIDPGQEADYTFGGRIAVEKAGFGDRHRLLNEPDFEALPRLLGDGQRIQFAYIDGWHTFDYVLLDFFYLDKMLDEGGVIAFNDCWMKAITRVIDFVLGHRRYEEIDVGLNSGAPSLRTQLGARLLGRPLHRQDRYFRKIAQHEPEWNFYRSF